MQKTPFSHKIYGAGYTITIEGPHTSSQGMQMNSGDTHDYGGLVSALNEGGAIYDVKVVITEGFAVQTWETWSTFTGGTTDYWLNVGGLVGYMNGGSQIDNVYVELADSTVRLASFKYISDGSPPQYVRAGAIVGEMGANATITNVTVNNKGLIVAGKNTGNASHSVSAERWYGAVGNVVGWAAANGGNITIDNVRITGNGILRGYRVGNIGVAENSNVTTANFFDNFTGTYDSYQSGYHKVYVNGEKGSNFDVTNVYRKGSASVAGAGETTATGMKIGTTLTVPSDSAYDIYFDATVSDRNNSLAIAFNQAPAASYEYTLVSGGGTTYENPKTTSSAIVFRKLPTAAATWKSGDNIFTATLNSELLFNPDTYENPLTKYEHGYTEGQTTSTGTPISTGDKWESIFAPSASGTPSGTYYLTDNIVINGFTDKEMSNVTIDGNGNTIFVIGATQSSYSGVRVGGLVGGFTNGTIKNVRVVYINSCSIASTGTNPRFGLVAGSVNGSTIENVQVYVESGVTISASKAGDNSVAMGGVVGYATNNSEFTNVTLDLNGTLAPTGAYQYLGGIVGLIDNEDGATFTNIILRGAGTFAGTAGNTSGEPTYYGAVGVIMAASTNITSAYATIDGLIYDFDVELAGTGGGGQSNNSYSCYYLFTNNYNAGASGGHKTDSPISGYEGGVTYSNIFVAEKYVSELEGFAGERTNGNAAVGIGSDTTIKAIAGEVTGVSGATVTAYFVPTGNNSDITLAASQPSGGWGGVSQLKSDGDFSAQSVNDGDMKVVTVAKANAATDDNKVTLSEYVPGTVVTVTGVATQLVYNAAEQGATFTFEGGSPELTTHYSVVYAVNDEDPKGAQLGDTRLPLNAGNYTATITLNEDGGFVFKSADGGYTRQTTFKFAVSPYELTLQSGIATALAGTYGDYTVTSGAVSGDKITSLTQETLFGSSVPGTVAYTVTVADQKDGWLNASTYSFTAGVSDTNYNLASGAIDGVVVSPYRVEGTWALDSGLTLAYGDPVPNIDQYISVTLTSTDIPGGLTSVAASGFNIEYTQGTAAGETVTITADTYSVDSGLTAGNYDFTGITGRGSLVVQKKTLNINPVSEEPDYMYDPHISAVYGATGDKAAVQGLLTWNTIGSYITGNYNGEEVSFTIDKIYIAATDEESGEFTLAGAEEVADENIASLDANSYLITVTADGGNYTVAEGEFFVYGVIPATLTVTGVAFEGDFDGVYDGQTHNVTVQYSGELVGGDVSYNFGIFINEIDGISVTDAGDYVVTVQPDEENANYDIGFENGAGDGMNEYTITIDPYDLANATVTIAESDLVYTGSPITVKPIVKGGENDFTSKLTAVVNGGEAVVNAGDYTITASDTNNSGNFTGEASGTFEVAQKQLKLESLTLSSSTYTGAPITVADHTFAADFGPADGEQPELSIVEENGATVQDAGTYTFDVTLKEASTYPVNANYVIAADGAKITATVSPASVTVTAGKNAELGALHGVSATADTSRFYKDDFITLSPQPDGTFTLADLADALTFTVKNNETQEYEQAAEGAYTLAPGTYTVTYSINNKDGANYTLTAAGDTLTTTLTVKEGALELVIERWDNTSPTYDGTAQLPTPVFADSAEIGEIEEGALVYEVTAKEGSSLTGSNAVNAGSYTVTVSIAEDYKEKYELVGGELSTDFTIERREVVLKWEAVGDLVYNGKEHTATATVNNKQGDDDVTVIVGLVIGNNNVNVGEFFFEATGLTGAAASNYKLPENAQSQAFNVKPAQVKITWNFGDGAKITYGDSVDAVKKLVNIDALDGEIPGVTDPLAFEVSVGDYSATMNAGAKVTFTVNAKLPEGATAENYEITVNAADGNTLTVDKATLTLAIADTASLTKVYDGEAVTLASLLTAENVSVEGMKNGEDAFTLGILAISGTDEMTNAGTYNGSVSVIDDCNYTAEAIEINYIVTPKPIGVAWTDTEFTYDGTAHKPTATAADLVEGDSLTLTVTGEQTNANAEGETYTATVKAFIDGNYKLEQDATVKFTIARKTVSVAWGNTEFTYNGSAQKPNATVGEGLVSGDDLQITVSGAETDANTDGGSYTATAEITGGEDMGNYVLDESSVSKNFTIAPKPITITFISDKGDAIDFDVAGSVTVGEWTIDSGNAGKATLVLSDGTTEITLTVEASDEALPTVENDPALLLLLDGDLYEGTPYGTKVEGGSLTVISADKNYVFEGAQAITLKITPAISVGLKDSVQTTLGLTDVLNTGYNAEYFKDNYLKVINKDGEEVTGGTLEVTITPPEGVELLEGVIKHAGKYTVTAVYTPDGAGESAELPTVSFEFTVTPVEVTSVTYSGGSFVYGDLSASGEIAVTVEYADGTKAENVTAQYTSENVSTARYVKAGEQTIKVYYTNNNSDYAAVTEHEITLTVEKKTITPSAISYGEVTSEGTTLTLTYAGKDAYANGNLAIATDDILSGDAVEFTSEGDYSAANEEGYTPNVTIVDAGDGGNYTLDLSGWKVVVLKKTIEVTVSADSDTYTGSAIKLTAASEEVVDGDVVTFTVSGERVVDQTVTNAGTYPLTVTLGGEQGGNYAVAEDATVEFTIAPKSIGVAWTDTEFTYDGTAQVPTATATGLVGGDSLTLIVTGAQTNAGSYTATVAAFEQGNYKLESTSTQTFTIAKMVLDGKWKVASDMDLTYDGTSKAGYATWTWTTEPLNEGDVTVGYKYELNGAIVDDVIDAGNYNVYAVFTDNTGNYDTESGILQGDRFDELTVARRAVSVEWSESVSFTYNGDAQAPTATALNVAQGDSLTLTVTGAKKDVGTYTATVEADSVTGNYVLAEDATVKFTIAPKSIGVAWGTTEFTYNGSAQVPTATATDLEGGDSLTLTVTGAQTNAGSYTATVEAFEQGNYKLESTSTQAFTIAKADLTVTPASLEIRERETEDMKAFAEGEDRVEAFAGRISVSGVSGTVSYTVAIAGDNNYDDDGLLTVGAHTFTIDAGDNYNAASVSVTVIATPVVTVIASVEGELVYNGSAFEISYALKEGAPEDVSMDDVTVTASVETIVNAGEYEVTFTVTGSNEDYDYVVQDASGNAALTFTIARRGLDVAEVAEAVYGDLQVSGTLVTGTHTAFVAYNDEEIELIVNVKAAALSRAAAEYLDAGEYEVTIALANENGNFSLNGATLNAETQKMEVQSTLDVAPKTVTVGYTTSSGVYDANGISITLDKFEDMLIEGDDPAVNIYINDAPYTGKVVLDAGEYTVRYESADPNYAFTPVSATFTVAPKSVTPNFDLNTGSGSLQITGGGKLEIEEGDETDIVAAIDNFMQSSGVSEEDMSIAVSGDLKLEDMATWAPGTYTVTVTLSGNHSGSMQFTVEVSEKVELPPPVEPELPENPVEAGSGNDWVLPLVIAIVALIDLALLVAIGVAAKKRA